MRVPARLSVPLLLETYDDFSGVEREGGRGEGFPSTSYIYVQINHPYFYLFIPHTKIKEIFILDLQ